MADIGKKPFLSGVSGAIAGVAALITAIGALIGALAGVGVIGGSSDKSTPHTGTQSAEAVSSAADWTSQANKLCAQTNDTINALPDPKTLNLKSGIAIGRQSVRISQQLFRDLAALPKPPDKEAQIDNFLRLGALVNQADAKLFDELKLGQIAAAVQAEHSLSKYGQKLDNAAIALGATTCAEGSSSLTTGLPGG